MADFATRGSFAEALYRALGFTSPSSTGKFTDAGDLDGIVSTLKDVGITNGIGGGLFGTGRTVTRGEAFTMIARALGLASPQDDIATATQALVGAGIVKGVNNDPNNLQIDQPLQADHLELLIKRVTPELSRPADKADPNAPSVGDALLDRAQDAQDSNLALRDPAYAAFLRASGLQEEQIRDQIQFRIDQTNAEIARRAAGFETDKTEAVENTGLAFEDRGLFRSGARIVEQQEAAARVTQDQLDFEAAQRLNMEEANRAAQRELTAVQTNEAEERLRAQAAAAEAALREQAQV